MSRFARNKRDTAGGEDLREDPVAWELAEKGLERHRLMPIAQRGPSSAGGRHGLPSTGVCVMVVGGRGA